MFCSSPVEQFAFYMGPTAAQSRHQNRAFTCSQVCFTRPQPGSKSASTENHFDSSHRTSGNNLSPKHLHSIVKWKSVLPWLCTFAHVPGKDEMKWKYPPRADFSPSAEYTVLPLTPKPLYGIIAEAYVQFFFVQSIKRRERMGEKIRTKEDKREGGWRIRETKSRWSWVIVSGPVLHWDEGWANTETYRRAQSHGNTYTHSNTLKHRGPAVSIYNGLLNTNAHCESNQIKPSSVPWIQ